MVPPPPSSTPFPYTTLFRSQAGQYEVRFFPNGSFTLGATSAAITVQITAPPPPPPVPTSVTLARKSTPLNSSHADSTHAATAADEKSDGSAFAGTLTIGAND